jgi:serine protease inhibitor
VLVNAIHLKLPWNDPFLETSTKPATFTKTDGSTANVPFMNKGGYLPYAEVTSQKLVAEFVDFLTRGGRCGWCRGIRDGRDPAPS